MSEKLTVAELMARNATDGARRADRPRRRRNLEDGGVSVSELTGSIPVVSDEDLEQDGAREDAGEAASAGPDGDAAGSADSHPHRGGHELVDDDADDTDDTTDADGAAEDVPTSDAAVVEGEVVDEVVDEDAVAPSDQAEVAEAPEDVVAADELGTETTVLPRVEAESVPAGPAGEQQDAEAVDDVREVAADDTDGADETDAAPVEAAEAVAVDGVDPDDPDTIIEYEDDAISWPALLGQTAIALVIGVVIFFGFTLLWDRLGTALVLVMAGVVTLVCVGVVHALLRHRHALVLILAFVVGLVITLGPRLIMSI
jgi:colicin import membrane protein